MRIKWCHFGSTFIVAVGVVLLGACSSDDALPANQTPDPGAETRDPGQDPNDPDDGDGPSGSSTLKGLWRVTWEGMSTFGTTGTMTLEFPAEHSGVARFIGQDDQSGITTCGNYVFSLRDGVVLLDASLLPRGVFDVAQVDDDTIKLTREGEALTLSRLSGPRPVEDCVAVEVSAVPLNDVKASLARLSAVDDVLYFNASEHGEPIVGYSLGSKKLLPRRTYTDGPIGQVASYIVAAADHDIFFGHCRCGDDTRVSRFDATANQLLLSVDTSTLGSPINIGYGALDVDDLVIGGRGTDGSNRLLTLDPRTLTLRSTRDILEGELVMDITYLEGELHALTQAGYVVEVGTDGKAAKTYDLPELRERIYDSHRGPRGVLQGVYVSGLTSAGGKLYVLGEGPLGRNLLFEITRK